MGAQQRVQFRIYDNVAIILILFASIGCIEVGSCEPSSDTNNFNSCVSCTSKRHLLTSYFEKYECLLDSNFQDFITNELHSQKCQVLPDDLIHVIRPSVLQRHLIGEGSHRNLSSSIRFVFDQAASQLSIHCCEVIFVERVPSGIFADPFELQHLHQRGVFADVAVFGDTNLELPSFLSNQSAVEVHMNVDSSSLLTHKNEIEIKVDLPLHARYQRLDESGYATIEFGDPDLFMHCCLEGKSHNQSCLYIPISNGAESKIGVAIWRIPSGIKGHAGAVSVVTFISAFLSTLSIVLTSIFFSDVKPYKSSKQL